MLKWIIGGIILIAALLAASYVWAGCNEVPLTNEHRMGKPGDSAQLSHGRLHYEFSGPKDGPLIVLVHGFSTPSFIFAQNVAALNEAGFRTLQFDHYGRGLSDRPRAIYDTDFYDAELTELLDMLAITEPVGLVGLSMGGPIVTEFTARHPERVSRVFLFVPAGFDLSSAGGRGAGLIRTPVIGDFLWRMNWKKTLLSDPQYKEETLTPENRLQGDFLEQLKYKGYSEALLSTLRHFPMSGREETYERFAATGLPMKAIFGDADPTILISSADGLRAAVPSAEIRILQGADHGLNYKRHADVNADLVTWFQQN